MKRRTLIASGLAALGSPAIIRPAAAQATPGVTATELKIGGIMPYSGPASSYGTIGRLQQAYFKAVNDAGGVGGRKINFISLDDGYSPPKTVEVARRLVEQEGVAFLFNTLGTPTNSAIHRYMNQRKVPHLFLATGADKWAQPKEFPWTIGWQPSYRVEAQIYAKYILTTKPNAKIGLLYQNDDFGKDYLLGLKDGLGTKADKMLVQTLTYEVTDATIDSQIVSLQGAGVDVLVTATAPKAAAQSIRKVYDLGWKPLHIMSNVSISIGSVLEPAGTEKAVGLLSADYRKVPTDPQWKDDPGIKEWAAWMDKNMPDADRSDNNYIYSYAVTRTLMHVLEQCKGDFSRETIMRQATGIKNLDVGVLLPGVVINTSATNFHPIRQMQMTRWTGKTWDLFGNVIEGTEA